MNVSPIRCSAPISMPMGPPSMPSSLQIARTLGIGAYVSES